MRVILDTNVLILVIIFLNDRMDGLFYKTALDHWFVLTSYIISEFLKRH
jgi:predicted nucleic acid-binding protein